MATTYNFNPHKKGDTMEALVFTIEVNGTPADIASAKMDVRDDQGKRLIRYTTEPDGGLTIVGPSTDGKIRFDEKIVDIPAGTHIYDIETVLTNGKKKTYIAGEFPVIQDVTYGAVAE